MDPITAIGFASSLITFVDFGLKIVTGTLEVVKSGSLAENSNISIIINDLHALVSPLAQHPPGTSAHELALKELATECQQVSQKLIELLDKLKTSPDSSLWKSVRVTLKSMRKKGEVSKLESQLDKYRSEIMTRLLFILNEGQMSIELQLSGLQSQMQNRPVDATTQLQQLLNSIQEKIELALREPDLLAPHASHCGSGEEAPEEIVGASEQSEALQILQEVKAKIDTLLQSRNGPTPEFRILKRVFFPSLYLRKEQARSADVDTFEWILTEPGQKSAEESHKGSPGSPAEESGEAARTKTAAASKLQQWLRNSSGVFHISGKAGCGKSTMMKLLFESQRTRQELDHWSGEQTLLFAHFFFWSSGDQLQQSLEGLYRSLLFEILIQCPQLTREVFPSAYNTFMRKNADECIEDLFFTPKAFRDAFQLLISRPPQSRHRICLFIDGLDEYGGGRDDYNGGDVDELEHQRLAESLSEWASQNNVKMLVSSRPHRAFGDTFDNDLRIRLHELTRVDIIRSCRQLFEKDKSFQRQEVKDCYKDLVEKVAEQSEGVFLWATLAVRDLLNCIKRHDRIALLGNRLEGMPRNFNKLYERMFNSIDIRDRTKAMNLMLLVEASGTHGYFLNTLSITWLDDLENPEFPAHCKFEPYTTEEIESRQLEAERQLDSLTKGLLEVKKHPPRWGFFGKYVGFFHRTVRDFVRQSEISQKFSIKGSNYTAVETCSRLQLAEWSFATSEDIRSNPILHSTNCLFWIIEYRPSLDTVLEGYERAFNHQNLDELTPSFLGRTISITEGWHRRDGVSFPHFLAHVGYTDWVKKRVAANPDQLSSTSDLSLLLSAASGNRYAAATTKLLLDTGASPYDLIKSQSKGSEDLRFTVWHWFCFILCGVPSPRGFFPGMCKSLQFFIEAGVNRDCHFLFCPKAVHRLNEKETERPSTYVLTLEAYVRMCNPPNLQDYWNYWKNQGLRQKYPARSIQSTISLLLREWF